MPFLNANGAQLFYRDWGSGRPVVFVTSWALSGSMWQYQMQHLADKGFRAVGYDRRGHGRSDDPGGGYDIDTLADDLAALVEHLDLTDVTLVGHSMGGGEIVRYLTRHGDARVARIVLVGSTLPCLPQLPDNPNGIPAAAREQLLAQLRVDFGGWIDENAGPFFGDGLPGCELPQATRDWTIRDCMSVNLHAAIGCLTANATTDFRPELAKVTVPALILHGDHDASAPLELCGRVTAELLADAELKVYTNAAHALYLTHTERLNADLLDFVRK
ncbi:alpha/beta fold hydrolase [Kutzneria sp. CA-103260]|uniref:alpha/beta fold hydrolase n=1 Tax=Kutzneria sp. CA-103260 TaxID=2802641 RepID=UPI001BA5E5D8|nr:alpha/beta hydrolase [Kutzneria sp. CA-103260]QUQ63608.1 alpha/beta hydrolase [Kutzneria sp. CA-103260]